MTCPLTVTKCQRSDFTGRVNEIPYVAYEVPVHGVLVRTISCGLTFKKRPEKHPPKPWWATGGWEPVPAPRGSAEDLLGLVPAQIRLGELEQLAPGSSQCKAAAEEVARIKGLVVEAWRNERPLTVALADHGERLLSKELAWRLFGRGVEVEHFVHDTVTLSVHAKDLEDAKDALAKAWRATWTACQWYQKDPVKPTTDNPNGNPPVMCEHCRKDVRWPDRESCEKCGGFTCGCVCDE